MTTYSGPKLPCTSPAWWTEASPVALPMASGLELQAGKRAVVGHRLQQRSPGHVLADQERVVVDHARVDDPGGAERRHPGRRAGLGREPVPLGRVPRPAPAQQPHYHFRARTAPATENGPVPGMPEIRPAQPVSADPVGVLGAQRGDVRHGSTPRRGRERQHEWFVPYALCAVIVEPNRDRLLAGQRRVRRVGQRGERAGNRALGPVRRGLGGTTRAPCLAVEVCLAPGRGRIPRRNRAQPRLPERYIRATRLVKMEG